MESLDPRFRGDDKTESPSRLVEASWPEADFIIGNPPFLGGKLMRGSMGDEYVRAVRGPFEGRLSEFADYVCYWFEKANKQIDAHKADRVGLVATNSIRGGANRRVLEDITAKSRFIEAWSDEPWTVDGAAVRVSIVCFGNKFEAESVRLNGQLSSTIYSDLTAGATDLTKAKALRENEKTCFEGGQKHGPFELSRDIAQEFLCAPINPNGRPNADVLYTYLNATDVVRRRGDTWIIAFPDELTEHEASLYQAPFEYVLSHVKPIRENDKESRKRELWWRHHRSRPELRKAIGGLRRFIVTPVVAKYRIFVWIAGYVLPTNLVDVIARDDDTTFGILHSRFHEAWSLRLGTWLGVGNDPRYTPTTTFETFPFPAGLTPDIAAADTAADPRAQRIATAAKTLDELRRAWLDPPDLVEIVPEITPTAAPGEAPRRYPDRILPKNVEAAVKLKARTLTNLYNQRPRWLADAHDALDRAVAAAYGWPEDVATDDALQRLLALNLERAAAQRETDDEGEAG